MGDQINAGPPRLDPGPPLVPGEEYCAGEPPSDQEYMRAFTMAGLASLVSGAAVFAGVLLTGRFWSVIPVATGAGLGWLVHWSANGHRSTALGALAAAASLAGTLLGYAVLWLPVVPASVDRSVNWYHPVTLVIGLFLAYRFAGSGLLPKNKG